MHIDLKFFPALPEVIHAPAMDAVTLDHRILVREKHPR
jgi:hypothetical protein